MGRSTKSTNRKRVGRVQEKAVESKVDTESTRVRDFGDGETIVLYTAEKEIYKALEEKAIKEIPYEIWKDSDPTQAKWVAVDLYFPKSARGTVEKVVDMVHKYGKDAAHRASYQRLIKKL